MTIGVNVSGGTGAGNKKAFQGDRPDWTCGLCHTWNRGYWTNCPRCAAPGPKP